MVNLSDLILVPCQECKEGLVHTILGKSAPESTFIQHFKYCYACELMWQGGRSVLKWICVSTNRGLNSSPIQEKNFQLTYEVTC